MTELSIVVPTYNSAEYLAHTITALCEGLQVSGLSFEILVVADGDGADDPLALRLPIASRFPGLVRWVQLNRNEGQQVTTQLGAHLAAGRFIVTYDDDMQYLPEDIFRLYRAIAADERYDVVTGYYPQKPERGIYSVLSRLFVWLLNGVLFRPYRKANYFSSFKIFRRSLFDARPESCNIYHFWEFDPARLTYITIQKQKRRLGKTSYSAFKRLRFVFPILCKCMNRALPFLLPVPLLLSFCCGNGVAVPVFAAMAILYLADAAVLYRHKYRFRNVSYQIITS